MKKIVVFLFFSGAAIVSVVFIINRFGATEEGAFASLCLAPLVGGLLLAIGFLSLFRKTEKDNKPPMATRKK